MEARYCSILRQQIFFEETFLKSNLDHVELFVQKCILPDLVCHWFTRNHPPRTSSSQPATASAPNSLTSSDPLVSQPHEDNDSSRAEQIPSSLEVIASVALTGDSELTTALSSMTKNDFIVSSEIDEDMWCSCKHSEDYDFMIAYEAKDCK